MTDNKIFENTSYYKNGSDEREVSGSGVSTKETQNRNRYKRAFSVLHASDNTAFAAAHMERRKHAYMKKILAASAAVVLVCSSFTAAYAADLGGIREKLTAWFRGEETQVTASRTGTNSYRFTYTDPDGNGQEFGGGGVAIDDSGEEHALSAQEVLDEASTEIVRTDDGQIVLFLPDTQQQLDITDHFDVDGNCRIAIQTDSKTIYFKIEDNGYGGFAYTRSEEAPKNAQNYTLIGP